MTRRSAEAAGRGGAWLRAAALACTAALLGACGAIPMGQAQPSLDSIRLAKASLPAPVALGTFALAPGKDAALDVSVRVRAHTLTPPQGSFARYLRDTLEAELRAAGLLDAQAGTVIEGQLLDRRLDPAMGTASASLTARFVVRRAAHLAYAREFTAESSWPSSFVGAEAIPLAINEFTTLFRKLVGQLLGDPRLREAMARQ